MDTGEPVDGASPDDAPDEVGLAGLPDGPDAADGLHNRVWAAAYAAARRYLPEYHASEVAQDVAIDFVRKWRSGVLDRSDDLLIEIWAVRAARYAHMNLRRAKERGEAREFTLEVDEMDLQTEGRAHSPDQLYDASELAEVIRRGFLALPRRMREVFVAIREYGEKPASIAARLHISEKTVSWHYTKAFERLHAIAMRFVTQGLVPEGK